MNIKNSFGKKLILSLVFLASASAYADQLDSWNYFDGASRTINNNNGWIQLESSSKNYCNGRVRLQRNPEEYSYTLEVQGSWCKIVKFGFEEQGSRYQQTNSTMRFALDKNENSEMGWTGYGGSFNIPIAAMLRMSNGVSIGQMSMVLYTDSREDTHQQAYEKLTIDLGLGFGSQPSAPQEPSGPKMDERTSFDGASRTVSNNNGFIQLESNSKNYCNGRVRLSKSDAQNFTLDVEGTWCKVVKFGFLSEGNLYRTTGSTQRFVLEKSNDEREGWTGYRGSFNIPIAAMLRMSNGISLSQMSMVLYTDSRDDTHQQAYEKLTIDLGSELQGENGNNPGNQEIDQCLQAARVAIATYAHVSQVHLSVQFARESHAGNLVYKVIVLDGHTYEVTTSPDASCRILAKQIIR